MKHFTWLLLLLVSALPTPAPAVVELCVSGLASLVAGKELTVAQVERVKRAVKEVDSFLGKLEPPPNEYPLRLYSNDVQHEAYIANEYGRLVTLINLQTFFGREERVLARERKVSAEMDDPTWFKRRQGELKNELDALRELVNEKLSNGEAVSREQLSAAARTPEDLRQQMDSEWSGHVPFRDFTLIRPNYLNLLGDLISTLERKEPQSGSEDDYLTPLAPTYAYIGRTLHVDTKMSRTRKLEIVFDAVGEELVERYLDPKLDMALEQHLEAMNRRLIAKIAARLR